MILLVHEFTVKKAVVAVEGRLDAFTAPNLRIKLEALLADGTTNLVINLFEITFLDSAGLAVLVSLLKQAREKDGNVKLVLPRAEVGRRILRLTRFDRVFEVFETLEDALS